MEGGFPLGAISEVTGPQSSGRTSLVLSFLTQRTHENQVVAWVDAEDAFDPESAAANSVSLRQLLWVRCRNAIGPAKGKPWARLDQAVQATGQPGLHHRQCGGGSHTYYGCNQRGLYTIAVAAAGNDACLVAIPSTKFIWRLCSQQWAPVASVFSWQSLHGKLAQF
jgi:hypothetical protein